MDSNRGHSLEILAVGNSSPAFKNMNGLKHSVFPAWPPS
jgi:hypothetical protein